MSDVIRMLDAMGRGANKGDPAIARWRERLGPAARAAWDAGDFETLARLEGIEANLVGFIFSPDENDQPEPDQAPVAPTPDEPADSPDERAA